MASNFVIALLVGIGFGGWVFAKMQRQTGGNTKSSLTVAIGSGLVALILVTVILGMLFH
jgi:hypothetical protein